MNTTIQPEGSTPPTIRTQLHQFDTTISGRPVFAGDPTLDEIMDAVSEDLNRKLMGAVASGYAVETVKFSVFKSENSKSVLIRTHLSALDIRDILPPR